MAGKNRYEVTRQSTRTDVPIGHIGTVVFTYDWTCRVCGESTTGYGRRDDARRHARLHCTEEHGDWKEPDQPVNPADRVQVTVYQHNNFSFSVDVLSETQASALCDLLIPNKMVSSMAVYKGDDRIQTFSYTDLKELRR
jgi:hypothetical protein